jgi:hypothetical protein
VVGTLRALIVGRRSTHLRLAFLLPWPRGAMAGVAICGRHCCLWHDVKLGGGLRAQDLLQLRRGPNGAVAMQNYNVL